MSKKPIVGIVMGSNSDWDTMQHAAQMLEQFGITHEAKVLSAHRMPDDMFQYAENARTNGLQAIIAGAGGAAHLPGMVAAYTILPVIGVPVKSSNSIDGWDSVLSILQMPTGVPVATVALNGAKNAAILATQILATSNQEIAKKLLDYKSELNNQVLEMVERIKS